MKKRVNDNQISTVDSSLHNGDSIFLQGCTWDPSMWACAYDAAIMSFFALYVTAISNWKTDWSTQMTLSPRLVNDLENLLADDTYTSSQLNFVQNSLQSSLIDKNPTLFPQEPMPVAVSDILENICSLNQNRVSCLSCLQSSPETYDPLELNAIPTFFQQSSLIHCGLNMHLYQT